MAADSHHGPRIAIAVGDPNGIGPEIAVKAAARLVQGPVQLVLVADAHVLQHYAQAHAPGLPLMPWAEGRSASGLLQYLDVPALAPAGFHPGKPDAASGSATVAYVRRALQLAQGGAVDAVIGCPHSERAVNDAGIAFDGYPGLVARLTGLPADGAFLMLAAQGLRIAHVTLHESVRHALDRLSVDLVVQAGLATVGMMRRLGVHDATLGVFGINPHAGEDGLFGDEDQRITLPAVQALRAQGVKADGPAGADLLLSQRRHDAYLAMFHDQGHIPVKLLSPLRASALTLGVPVTFSSVGHGCAPDIAGKGVADPASVLETISLLAGIRNPDD